MMSDQYILIETCTGVNHNSSNIIAVGSLTFLSYLKDAFEVANSNNENKIKVIIAYYRDYNDKFRSAYTSGISIEEYKTNNPIRYSEYLEFMDNHYIEYGFDILNIKDIRFHYKITFDIQTIKASQCEEVALSLRSFSS